MWVRDTTAGSGLCAWRSLGVLQAMNGLDGMAESTWDAFVVCAIDDRRKGSMQSVGTWSLKTEPGCPRRVVSVKDMSEQG